MNETLQAFLIVPLCSFVMAESWRSDSQFPACFAISAFTSSGAATFSFSAVSVTIPFFSGDRITSQRLSGELQSF